MLELEHLFFAGLGFDFAGAYLVARGLLQRIPQLATLGGTMFALERPRATYAVEDRIRGTVGLIALLVGFALQAGGYVAVLLDARIHYGADEALIGVAIAIGVITVVLIAEHLSRPRWRDSILIRVARFDHEGSGALRDRPVAHVLHSFGEQLGRPLLEGESDVEYCARVFNVVAEEL